MTQAIAPAALAATPPKTHSHRRQLTVLLFWLGAAAIVLACLVFAEPHDRWGCALAAFPTAMVVQHAVFLRLVRMPFRRSDGTDAGKPKGSQQIVDELGQTAFTTARETSHKYFSAGTLAIRYGVPAIMIGIIGLAVFYRLFRGDDSSIDPVERRAAQLGSAGAYTYVLLYLAQRNFRHDITSGGALWCAVVMAIGPVLAAALSQFVGADDGKASTAAPVKLTAEFAYFAVGMAPRHVTSFLVEAIKRLWVTPSLPSMPVPRTIPVTQVRGVSPDIADRLGEEGITDLYGLSTADPMRLIRNTSFDKRQIISWIDEAILIATIPDKWQAIENNGITGAIDFAWTLRDDAALASLSKQIDIPVDLLKPALIRLNQDAQLRLVWFLYDSVDSLDADSSQSQS